MTDQQQLVWKKVEGELKSHFGEEAYASWLKYILFDSIEDNYVVFSVPSRFLKDWISTHYGDKLLELWQRFDGHVKFINILVKDNPDFKHTPSLAGDVDKNGTTSEAPQHDFTVGLDQRYTFENFVVGKPNELAYAAAQRVADSKSVYFNPLFLYGGVGLGKTHLMHAIAWHIHKNQPKRKVLYMSAEQFMYRFVRALRHQDIMSFREQFRSVDVLMIDDVQFISGKDSTQEEFFHTFNALVDKKRQIIISADKSPSDLDGIQERVRSRLGWGLVVDIHPTTYELRLGILQLKIEGLEVAIPHEVIELLAHKITSNIRELEGALNRIVAHATLVGGPVTLETTHRVLQDLFRSHEKYLTIEDIQKHVAEHYNIRVSDMHSGKRLRVVARPRQVAMYLCKKFTTKSLPEIGRKFGGRDHTTVMHAVRKVEELKETEPSFKDDLNILEHVLTK